MAEFQECQVNAGCDSGGYLCGLSDTPSVYAWGKI